MQLYIGWCGMGGIAARNVQFVCGDHSKRGVAKFPPELMADGDDFNRCRRLWSVFDRVDYASGRKEQNQNDEDGQNRPGKLDLIAAVNWGRLAAIIVGAPPELHQGIGKQAENNCKDDRRNDEHEDCNMKDLISRRGRWPEYIRWRWIGPAETLARGKGKKCQQDKNFREQSSDTPNQRPMTSSTHHLLLPIKRWPASERWSGSFDGPPVAAANSSLFPFAHSPSDGGYFYSPLPGSR